MLPSKHPNLLLAGMGAGDAIGEFEEACTLVA